MMLEGRRPIDVVLASEFGRPLVEDILGGRNTARAVTAQLLDRVLTAFRIGDPDGAIPSSIDRIPYRAGSLEYRAQPPDLRLGALFHRHAGETREPPGQVPDEPTFYPDHDPKWVTYELLNPRPLLVGTHLGSVPQAYGEAWQSSRRSLLLLVPSVVARMERNVLINPSTRVPTHHPQPAPARLVGSAPVRSRGLSLSVA